MARMRGNSIRKKCCLYRTAIPRSSKEGADLIDDAGTPGDQSLADAMQ
jgi:hypothetical protein